MRKFLIKGLKVLVIVISVLMVIPYLIPTSFEDEIPCLPYENSVFFNTEDDVILHTQVYKPQEKELKKIVMIHGLGASTYSFSNNALALQESGYFVVSVDLPAFGYSSKDQGINHSQIENAKRIWQLLDKLDQDLDSNEPWTVVGHSMGGSTSLAMANQYPDRISSLILFSPAIVQRSNSFSWILKSPIGQWLKVFLRYNIITEKNITDILESAYYDSPTQQDIDNYLAPLQTTTTPQALLDFVITSENVSIEQLIPQDLDIHLIWGDSDTFVPPEQIETIKENYAIASVTLLENGGHNAHERDESVHQLMLDILNDNQ